MILLSNSFSLVPLLVGICAEMDSTSCEFVQSCFVAAVLFCCWSGCEDVPLRVGIVDIWVHVLGLIPNRQG